jgi:RNA polymerase sigma factor (sigma-70 family)
MSDFSDRMRDLTTAPSRFTTTHWSVVLEAARPDSPGGVDAFARLYRDYWYPLYVYVRRRGRSPQEAEDLTQDFFVSLIERQRLAGLEREGGRFRSFLLKSLQNFLANEWDRAMAQKRGGGRSIVSLDEVDAESRILANSATETPEALFEQQWAFAIIEHAMQHLETELRSAGKELVFQQLRLQLQGDRGGRPYAEIAADLGMSESAVKTTVYRLRCRFGELLRAEVARTVGDEAEVESELRHLIEVVSR